MKKITVFLLCLFILATSLTGCVSSNEDNQKETTKLNHEKIKIVTTIFPQYDWVKQILGDEINNFDIELLVKNGADLHNYQPTTEDIVKINTCDMFIYIGGESEKWIEDVLKNKSNESRIDINLMEVLGNSLKEELVIEGMEVEHDDETDESHEYDEHIWLSIKNAKILSSYIGEQLKIVDKDNSSYYSSQIEHYITLLNDLDNEYQTAINNAKHRTIIFADRFPFRYLFDDYNLKYYAAFLGCSAESEASFETLSFLSKKLDETHANYIVTIDGSNNKLAQAIIDNTITKNQEILTLNSMQSVIESDINQTFNYLYIMKKNLEIVKKVLN